MGTYEQIQNYARETLEGLDAELVQARADLAGAKVDVEEWRANAGRLADLVSEASANLDAANARVVALTAERDELQRRLDELTQPVPEPLPEPSPGLWFRQPERILGGAKRILAHYFGPYPRSLDNAATRAQTYYARHYLNPEGESGKFRDVGGFLRNAPIFRAPLPGNWRLEDCKFDVRAAMAAGIDGFLPDIMGESGGDSWDRNVLLAQAADEVIAETGLPFTVGAMLDTNGTLAKNYAAGTRTAAQVAAKLATFAGRPCSWLMDGKLVISSFKAEGLTAAQWRAILDELGKLGHPAVFYSVALNYNASAGLASATIGEGSWGFSADPALIRRAPNQAAESHSRGKRYMCPVNGQNVRPAGGWFDESLNTEGLRESWAKAIRDDADDVQLVTWSDYSEGAECAPSETRGWCELDLAAWYGARFKTGEFPAILRDAVILSHRSHPIGAQLTGGQAKRMQQWIGSGRPTSGQSKLRDAVEALCFLTAPATVRITSAAGVVEQQAPAGESVFTVALAIGAPPRVEVIRDGKVVADVASPVEVTAAPKVDNPQYFMFSSIRGTEGQRNPVA